MAAEYSCLIVAYNSPYKNVTDVLNALKNFPERVPISLGGRRGAGDHITASMVFKAAGIERATELRYVFANGGDSFTIEHLKNANNIVGISGYNSITTDAVKKNEIRIIGVTSNERIDGYMTLKEQGVDIEYAN